jgi:FMN phosphatase YigB (HAD superfamily)
VLTGRRWHGDPVPRSLDWAASRWQRPAWGPAEWRWRSFVPTDKLAAGMRAILFDFGGTLDYPRHWLDRFLAHYKTAGIEISRTELDRAYGKATRIAYQTGEAIRGYDLTDTVRYLVALQLDELRRQGSVNVRARLDQAANGHGLAAIADQITRAFVGESARGLDRSRKVLSSLVGRFKIGIVSNFYGNLDRVVADVGLAPMVDAVADSTRLGFYKPDLRIFEAALREIGVAATDAMMVGDSLDKDCQPARSLGMRTAWLRHSDLKETEQTQPLADFTLDSLEGLNKLEW